MLALLGTGMSKFYILTFKYFFITSMKQTQHTAIGARTTAFYVVFGQLDGGKVAFSGVWDTYVRGSTGVATCAAVRGTYC